MHALAAYHGPVDTLSWDKVLAEVRKQISAATAGRVLSSAVGGGLVTSNWFYTAPTDAASAEAYVAYWLAVGARVGYPALATAARAFYTRAAGRYKWASSGSASGIASVIDEGVRALDAANAYKDRRMAPLYRNFGLNSRADAIERAQGRADEQSSLRILVDTAAASAADVGKGLEKVGRVITNKKPPGTPDWLWWIQRNAWLVAGLGVAGVAAWFVLGPVLAPILGVRDAAAAASRRAADKAVARIGTVARNPRRRRRLRSR
jgi:hypothetical protein